MPTWPSPRSERLGTPKIPAIRFTRGSFFGASRFTYATACQVARPPLTDRTRSPRPQRAFTSRLPAVWSPSLPLDITTTWTGLLVLAGLAPARMAASLAAPDPRSSPRRLSDRAGISGASADFVRDCGTSHLDLAVLAGRPLPVERAICSNRRRYEGGNANA